MKALNVAVAVLVSLGSVAMARPSTWLMTCNDAERAVARNGKIVMNYRYSEKAGNLYKMYVSNPIHCERRKNAVDFAKAIVKTSDNDRCNIGYTCTFGYDGR